MGCHMQDSVIAAVDNFMYLGSIITNDGEIVNEVIVRLGKAARAFRCLRLSIFDDRGLSVQTKTCCGDIYLVVWIRDKGGEEY